MSDILVVDDDPAARDLVVTVLGYGGHRVREAADGAEALTLAELELPELIIADLLMPTMDGFEFVRRLRERPIFQRTPVIFYTASYLESEARNLARACGVEHIITKPAEPEHILDAVARALGAEHPPVAPPPRDEFHREHLSLLTAKLSQRAEQAVPRLNAMIELGLQLASERDRQRLLANFCTAARKIIGAKYAVVGLLDRLERKVRYPFVSGLHAEVAAQISGDPALYPVDAQIFANRERIRAETALRQSEARHRMLVEEARDVVFTLAADGTVTSLNPAFAAVSGWSAEEWLGRPFTGLVHPEDLAEAEALLARLQRGEKPPPFEVRMRTKSDAILVQEITVAPLFGEGQISGILAIARDVTERKLLEAQLRQSQKLESIGLLAGGVAHDFNNILTVIQGHSDLATVRGPLPQAAADSLQEIVRAVDRGAALTRQLLAFSRQQVMQTRGLDLNDLVAHMLRMLERLLGEDVVPEFAAAPEPALVRADAGMLEQVVVNLAVNARDAMPRGGRLGIRLAVVTLEAEQVRNDLEASAGRFVRLTVQDTGSGIAPEHRARLFEPFFTTKEVGKGTGLGLATVFGIVKQHRGWIDFETEVGRGTTFTIHLPAAGQRGSRARSGRAAGRTRRRQRDDPPRRG